MKQFTTYIDEAGNTGDNLIDHQQPFYVMAAVSVPDDKKTVMELILHEKFESVREIEEKEIKGTKWVKATNKQPALKNIIYDLLDNGGDIHIAIVEKRFMIAGMAVNTFLIMPATTVKTNRGCAHHRRALMQPTIITMSVPMTNSSK